MGIVRAAQRLVEISLVEELLDLPVDQIIILEPRRGQRPVAQAVRRTVGGAALSVGEQRGARQVGRAGRLNLVRGPGAIEMRDVALVIIFVQTRPPPFLERAVLGGAIGRSETHTSYLPSLMRIS